MATVRYNTCLWFTDQAEQAATFYTQVCDDSEILEIFRLTPESPAVTVAFRLGSQQFIALNGESAPAPSEAASIMVRCTDQDQIDRIWDALISNGGEPGVCGWLKDRFGVSWQIAPDRFVELITSSDADAAGRAMEALIGMSKIVIADLEAAANSDD